MLLHGTSKDNMNILSECIQMIKKECEHASDMALNVIFAGGYYADRIGYWQYNN